MTSVARRHEESGEYSDGSQDIENSNSRNDGSQVESEYESGESDSERSERDPDSQESERRVDDDEDRSNPQYIPKRGTFYEHDDRTAASGEESSDKTSELSVEKKEGAEPATERRRPPRKSEIINKWSHDKYNENEQMPKSREELVAIYGYDIRNEDAPPHARRNRRYGRGPNKYTRTWEDEDAYKRQTAAQNTPKKPPNPDEFPDLDTAAKRHSRKREVRGPRTRSKSQPVSNESLENGTQLRRNASIKAKKPAVKSGVKNVTAKPPPLKQTVKKDDKKLPALENLTITTSNNSEGARRVSAVAQQRPVPTHHAQSPQQTNAQSKPQQQVQPQQKQSQQQQSQQQQTTAGSESRGGSKRYSSLRQRPLADGYTPQQTQQQPQTTQQPAQQQPVQQQTAQQQQHRFAGGNGSGEYNGTHASSPAHAQTHQPHVIHQQVHRSSAPAHASSPPRQPQQHAPQQQVRLGIMEQQQIVPHQHHSIHNMTQPHAIGQLQPSQGYAPPAMMPAQFMQGGSGAVYGGAAMYQPQPQYPHPQMYPHHNYAGGGAGVYYRCEEAPRPAQRRPTAAIPIVKPNNDHRPANSEKDNIDRIVENMFVRKPWPAQGTDSKEKSDSRSSQEPRDSQPNSLTSSTISNESKPEGRDEKSLEREEVLPVPPPAQVAQTSSQMAQPAPPDSIPTDA